MKIQLLGRSSRFSRSPTRLFRTGASQDMPSRSRFPNRQYSRSPFAPEKTQRSVIRQYCVCDLHYTGSSLDLP